MKSRLVLWGTDAEERKVLLALALRTKESKVDIWAFPEEAATESFYKRMIDEWRVGREVPFPDTFTQYEVPFTSSNDLLPDGLKADRGDLVQQAQTEWQFVILSSRLYENYKDELQFFKDKLDRLDGFDNKLWEELKGFWEKVQRHIHDRVLFRDHGTELREITNSLFEQMKTMRRSFDAEFKAASKEVTEQFMSALDMIEERIKEDRGLHPIFEELKKLQKKYRDAKFTREDRNKVWDKLDAAFKAAKEKRFGPEAQKAQSGASRVERRLEGLNQAIGKMEKSIVYDQKDIEFEQERIEESHGQLEAQIRQAKLAMIQERIKSKQEKLADMLSTRADLEKRIEQEKKREEARRQKAERDQLRAQAKESVKEKIAEEIKHSTEERAQDEEHLKKAAGELTESMQRKARRGRKESLLAAVSDTVGESLQDLGDTIKAVADVVAERIEEAMEGEEE